MITSHFSKFSKLATAMAFISLTACQTMPQQTHSNPQTLTAKTLISQTIDQKFDKSYDFEKTFKYQLTPFYGENDIEKEDVSFIDLFLARQFAKQFNHLSKSKVESDCEKKFNQDFNEIYQQYDDEAITLSTLHQEIEQLSDEYQACEPTSDDVMATKNKASPLDRLSDFKPKDKTTEDLELVKAFKLTPQQIEVIDKHYLQNSKWTQKGSFHQPSQQMSMVFEQTTQQPFVEKYYRLPVLLDMKNLSITFEPDMFLPALPIVVVEALSKDLRDQSLYFQLPDDLQQNIPVVLLKDTLVKAIAKSYGDLDGQKFSDVPIDEYGRSLNAKRAIKVSLTPEDFGFILGRSMKYWAADLQKISQQHPEYIQKPDKFDEVLTLLANINQNYQANDLATVVKFVETFLPISIYGYHYYYFDDQNRLLGFHKIGQYHSAWLNAKLQSSTTNKIYYHTDHRPHAYYQPVPEQTIDGVQLIKQYQADKKRLKSIDDNYLLINAGKDETDEAQESQ